jgi:dynein heavy chain
MIVMTEDLENLSSALYNNQVPKQWAEYPSEKGLSSWTVDLERRIKYFQAWGTNGEPPVFWLGGFYSPHGFLTVLIFERRAFIRSGYTTTILQNQ